MIIAIAWCLAWGEGRQPQLDLSVLHRMRLSLQEGKEVPQEVRAVVEEIKELLNIPLDYCPEKIAQIQIDYPKLWEQKTRIGLVYGGATKIKQYVFEASKLPDIRGASALLDRINLVDLPAFFKCEESKDFPQCQQAKNYCQQVRNNWLDKAENFPNLANALIPELVIYSSGGNLKVTEFLIL